MFEFLSWLFFILFIGALVIAGGLLLRGYITTGSATGGLTGGFFAPKPDKRIDVVEQFNVDGRRRLMIIRRDDVEHLIMTGGPVDVVIETGIGEKKRTRTGGDYVEPVTPVFARAGRTFSPVGAQAAGGGGPSGVGLAGGQGAGSSIGSAAVEK